MSAPIDEQARLCEIEGQKQKFLLHRRGAKNSRISKIDVKTRCTVGESFLVRTSRIKSITSADNLWLNEEITQLQAKPSQTIRIDGEVAAELQMFASRHGESINDAVRHLLRLASPNPSQEVAK